MMRGRALSFASPGRVEVLPVELLAPGPGQVLVRSLVSAISAGTEMLVYRGQMPSDLPLDDTIPGMRELFRYPVAYGYSLVGEVVERGSGVDRDWQGRRVFAFAPHGTHLLAETAELLPLPDGVTPDMAVFLPSMETALSLAMDGRPALGERIFVFGQGVIGLLVTALLTRLPGTTVFTVDQFDRRRRASRARGAAEAVKPAAQEALLTGLGSEGADLVYELTGNPAALNDAIAAGGFGSRIVVGSWYGRKRVQVDLGSAFHRQHMRLISSQVSHLAPRWRARWTKDRRLAVVWRLIQELDPSDLISHRFSLEMAPDAYALLDQQPAEVLQIVFDYALPAEVGDRGPETGDQGLGG